jgi:hypothetical protein
MKIRTLSDQEQKYVFNDRRIFFLGNLHYFQISQSGPIVDYERAKRLENYVNIKYKYSILRVHL